MFPGRKAHNRHVPGRYPGRVRAERLKEMAKKNETTATRPPQELALMARLNEARKSNDPVKLTEVRDFIVAAKNVIADFNKLVDAYAASRGEDDPMRKVERIALRESGAGRPSKSEEDRMKEIFGES